MYTENNIIFIHFLNDQILTLYKFSSRFREELIIKTLVDSIRYLVLYKNSFLIIPTVDIIQSPFFEKIFPYIQRYIDYGIINFVGSELSTNDIIESKYKHFQGTNIHTKWFDKDTYNKLDALSTSLIRKNFSTTDDMLEQWDKLILDIDQGSLKNFNSKIITKSHNYLTSPVSSHKFIKKLSKLPDKLQGHAFLWSVIEDTKILKLNFDKKGKENLEFVLASIWLNSYIQEYHCKVVSFLPSLGYIDCNLLHTQSDILINLDHFKNKLNNLKILDLLNTLTPDELITLRENSVYQKSYDLLISKDFYITPEQSNFISKSIKKINKEKIATYDKIVKILNLYNEILDYDFSKILKSRSEEVGMKEKKFGVIIALKEEFRVFDSVISTACKHKSNENGFYIYDFHEFKIIVKLIGDMGGENASIQALKLISEYDNITIVNIGIAGALSDDVSIGDVIIADQVESYLKVAKASQETKEESEYELKLSGEAYRPTRKLLEEIDNFEFMHEKAYKEWQEQSKSLLQEKLSENVIKELEDKKLISEFPKLEKGHIASGDIVAGSTNFVKTLKKKDRKYLAIEMEAGGILNAIEKSSSNEVDSIVLRGISDFSDERKEELDNIGEGSLRSYAMENATRFFLAYIRER